jgi:hypothetical protein
LENDEKWEDKHERDEWGKYMQVKRFRRKPGGYEGLDVEWVLLMTEAKKMGLIPQEIRQYLRSEEPDWPAIRKVRKVQ